MIKSLLRIFIISSAVISSLLAAYSPVLAVSKNSKPKPNSVSTPEPDSISKPKPASIPKPKPDSISKPKPDSVSKPKPDFVNTSAIAEADEYLDDVTDALQVADKATNKVEQDKFFETALTTMDNANDVIEEAKLSADADAMDDFTDAIEAAQAAKNESERQKSIDAALSAVDDTADFRFMKHSSSSSQTNFLGV